MHNKSHNLHLILGLNCCLHTCTPRSRYYETDSAMIVWPYKIISGYQLGSKYCKTAKTEQEKGQF